MIFVTLGTQNFAMDRVIKEIDHLIEKGFLNSNEVIIQCGASKPSRHAVTYKFINENEFNQYLIACDILITHAGTSSIIKGLRAGKKVIVIPREKDRGEHVDNHQFEIAEVFGSQNYVLVIKNVQQLEESIKKIKNMNFKEYNSQGELASYIAKNYLINK
ncbi:PssE/Cps14G family polysaccharide biosynthesis glycosyltransferase [Sporolactobacillus sp. KGMB 08714]|uniref:PssE/Cps14G family polysaccharide biosynthesis glycosyltransferase n=1 Tax=Sporolactobacillus sp. KGMB 08714 TaxID=3064704 RepID=UPI002FBEE4DE